MRKFISLAALALSSGGAVIGAAGTASAATSPGHDAPFEPASWSATAPSVGGSLFAFASRCVDRADAIHIAGNQHARWDDDCCVPCEHMPPPPPHCPPPHPMPCPPPPPPCPPPVMTPPCPPPHPMPCPPPPPPGPCDMDDHSWHEHAATAGHEGIAKDAGASGLESTVGSLPLVGGLL
jgi:hypothetical protein